MFHRKKTKGFLLALFFVLALPALGQPKNLKLMYGSRYTRPDAGLRRYGRNAVFFSARKEKFLNDTFHYYSQEGGIKGGWGAEISYSFVVWGPFALEATGVYAAYNVENLHAGVDESRVDRWGFECFADVFPLPYIGKISNYIAPYAGIGYQYTGLNWGKDIMANTGSAMFKVGTQIRLGRRFSLRAEYKQTFPKSSNKLFSAWDFGIGYLF